MPAKDKKNVAESYLHNATVNHFSKLHKRILWVQTTIWY